MASGFSVGGDAPGNLGWNGFIIIQMSKEPTQEIEEPGVGGQLQNCECFWLHSSSPDQFPSSSLLHYESWETVLVIIIYTYQKYKTTYLTKMYLIL